MQQTRHWLGEYINLHERINQDRRDKIQGWDEALMEEARIQAEKTGKNTEKDEMQNAPEDRPSMKRTYVMLYSDNEDDMLSEEENEPTSDETKKTAV